LAQSGLWGAERDVLVEQSLRGTAKVSLRCRSAGVAGRRVEIGRKGGRTVRAKGELAGDRLFGALLVAAVVVVLVGWATMLVYLGLHLF
jgi:hypothetical protein